jgi:hypothetical protein
LLHDERIAHDESGHSGFIVTRRFPYDGAMVEFHEEHQATLTQHFPDRTFELWKRPCGCRRFRKHNHVGMAYGSFNRG